jgi:microcystin-dependent protein
MGLETGTYINDLVITNPPGTDNRSEGDDHIRLLKKCITNTFPGMAGRFRLFQTKAVGYAPVLTDNTSVLRCTAALALTLATVATYGNGWEVIVLADGGDVTITPNGAEKINGQATFVVPDGYVGLLQASAVASSEYYLMIVPYTAFLGVGAAIVGNITLTSSTFGGVRQITASAVVTLPLASTVKQGRAILFKSTTTGDVTLAPNGTDTIDGFNASWRIPSYCEVELTKIGAGWIVTRDPHCYVGELRPISAAISPPNGWVRADFSAISRTTYAGLFVITGTAHGSGDGSTTFNVQDTRDRDLKGDGAGATVEAVNAAQVDTAGDTFQVGSNNDKWNNCMPIQLMTTGTLPAPLAISTTYYVVRSSATLIKLATTLANAQNGVTLDITTQGTGIHTLTYTARTRAVGDLGGENAHAITRDGEMPAHLHTVNDPTHTHTGTVAGDSSAVGNGATFRQGVSSTPISALAINAAATGISLNSVGGNTAMNIETPFGVARFMVKT